MTTEPVATEEFTEPELQPTPTATDSTFETETATEPVDSGVTIEPTGSNVNDEIAEIEEAQIEENGGV